MDNNTSTTSAEDKNVVSDWKENCINILGLNFREIFAISEAQCINQKINRIFMSSIFLFVIFGGLIFLLVLKQQSNKNKKLSSVIKTIYKNVNTNFFLENMN